MKRLIFPFLSIVLMLNSCQEKLNFSPIKSINDTIPQKTLTEEELKFWHFKDIEIDSLPGLSLDRVYDSIIPKLNRGEDIIVAVIDMPIDINHEDLKQNIWVNEDEIPNNNKDDDSNGYVDDMNGWNFIADSKGNTLKFVNYEYTRILRVYKSDFENHTFKDSLLYNEYLRAKKKYDERMKYAIEDTAYINTQWRGKVQIKKTLSRFFDDENYTISQLDSLKNLHQNDSIVNFHIRMMKVFMQYGFTDEFIDDYRLRANARLNKLLNLDFNDRESRKDDPEDINDIGYGSPIVDTYDGFFDHGTKVAGLIAARRDNKKGAKGIYDNIKIMSLCVASFGDEHDKDIALAIRYAVDNGAKVINMSFGKEFSLKEQLVLDAIKYAADNDVMIIKSAGNSGKDLKEFVVYPNDNDDKNNKELADNFLMVGASNYEVNEKLFPSYSNYGANQVDVFAPGENMYTTIATDKKYELNPGGTSTSAAVTSGTAALIRSYYPSLSASQVKHILMDSGVEYNFKVKVGDTLLPFKSLSKSGKVVNAYNAMIMADSLARK